MASPSFLEPAGLQRIRFPEDLTESDVHTTPGKQGAHLTFNYTEEGAAGEAGRRIRTVCFGKTENHETECSRKLCIT